MILQALKDYYDRKAADLDGGIAPEGFEDKQIPFLIVIDEDGRYINLEFTGDATTNKKGRSFLVPMWKQKSGKDSWKTTNFLWDHYGYVLGLPKGELNKEIEQAKKQHESFVKMVSLAKNLLPNNKSVNAIYNFYLSDQLAEVLKDERIEDIKAVLGCTLTFRVNSDLYPVTQDSDVISVADRWTGTNFVLDSEAVAISAICLVTGEFSTISRLHRPISGVNKKPSPMLAVNDTESPAFSSFNKSQGSNFPVGEKAAFKYATALNYLLRRNSTQKVQVGDATTVFWSVRKSYLESNFCSLFDEPEKDNPDSLTDAVKSLYKSVNAGAMPSHDEDTPFFVLGLSPNAARISVRFWKTGTVADFSQRVLEYFDSMKLCGHPNTKDYLPLKSYLRAIAPLSDLERIPPNMAGDWMRSILDGSPFPDPMFQMALRKIKLPRDERKFPNRVSFEIEIQAPSVAIIKACLNRKMKFQLQSQSEKEMAVSLDKENQNAGYRLGRLFAVLEKVQEEAQPGINATIRDRYYSAASGTPASVMPILMRMKNHHLAKLPEKGRQIYFERLIGEIVGAVHDFPNQLNLQDQGRFAIGYYHQRQDFFTKADQTN